MPVFQLWDHPQMRLCQATVEDRRRDRDKFGFRPRYIVQVSDKEHADAVIGMLDDSMGRATKAHGTYQCDYDDLRAAYQAILDTAGPDPRRHARLITRYAAYGLAVILAIFTTICLPIATIGFLILSAIRRQSGIYAMFEYEIICGIFDKRPQIKALIKYARNV